MESDLYLISKIQKENDEQSLIELINRHSGIYTTMVSRFASGKSTVLDKDLIMEDKNYTIYSSALKFDPSRETKFSTYLANETKWKCLNTINKLKKRKESYIDDDLNFIEPFCDDFIGDINKEEALEGFKKLLEEEIDERIKKIIDMRYNSDNNKLIAWKIIAKEMKMSIQGCINIHNKFITKHQKELCITQ
jgi:DNA-directed RNA polymerase sigma subunit (sigma70/sigma32)